MIFLRRLRWVLSPAPRNVQSCLRRGFPVLTRGVNTANFFESPPAAAPVAAAGFAVPFGHAFPFFAVGDDRFAFLYRFL